MSATTTRARLGVAVMGLTVLGPLLVACSDDDDPSASTTSLTAPPSTETTTTTQDWSAVEASEDFCAAVQTLLDLNEQTTPLIATVVDASQGSDSTVDTTVQAALAELDALAPQLVDGYDSLAGTAPPELAPSIADFRAGSLAMLAAFDEAAETGDLGAAVAQVDPTQTQAAIEGATTISIVTEEDCGLSLVT